MPDMAQHQAADLQRLALPNLASRLMVACSHGAQVGERPLLWSLCAQWVHAGLRVVVLDGYARETSANPGLIHRLQPEQPHAPQDPLDETPWIVWPAALGLSQIARQGLPIGVLRQFCPGPVVVVMYTTVDTWLSIAPSNVGTALMTVAPSRQAHLSAYAALKQVAAAGRNLPVVVKIRDRAAEACDPHVPDSLSQCVHRYLRQPLITYSVHARSTRQQAAEDIERLALLLWEHASCDAPEPTHLLH